MLKVLAQNGKTVNYYECVICKSLNHATRIHCRSCGTIPAMYSILGKPEASDRHCEAVVAFGAVRAAQHHQRLFMRTVQFDYYAEA